MKLSLRGAPAKQSTYVVPLPRLVRGINRGIQLRLPGSRGQVVGAGRRKDWRRLACLSVILLGLLCTACGWQLRNSAEVPHQLKSLYLRSSNLDSHFKVQLINLLESMKINLVPSPETAPLTLHIYNYSFTHNNPPISTTNVAIYYTFTLKVTVEITDAKGAVIVPPYTVVAYTDISVNVNQIFTINSVSMFRQELQREAINRIYFWLTSDSMRALLNEKLGTKRAVKYQTTPPTS